MLTTYSVPIKELTYERIDPHFWLESTRRHHNTLAKMKKAGISVKPLSDCADEINWPGRIKRIPARRYNGTPFLTASQVFSSIEQLSSRVEKFSHNPDSRLSIPDEDCILITRSGTLGRNIFAHTHLDGCVVSDDLVRVSEPKTGISLEYIYAYLNTEMGFELLVRRTNGSVIHHVDDVTTSLVKMPILDVHDKITLGIREVNKLREDGLSLCQQARDLLVKQLGLTEILTTFDEESHANGGLQTFTATLEYRRFDPSYYNNLVSTALSELPLTSTLVTLGEVATVYTPPRFKRQFAASQDYGHRVMSGKHIGLLKFDATKFLSSKMPKIEKYILEKGTIVVAGSGTIGRVSIIGQRRDGWAADNHVVRITPKDTLIEAGYLACFMETEHGQVLMKRGSYGSVVVEIGEDPTALLRMKIPIPKQKGLMKKVSDLYTKGQAKLEEAYDLELKTIAELNDAINAYG